MLIKDVDSKGQFSESTCVFDGIIFVILKSMKKFLLIFLGLEFHV